MEKYFEIKYFFEYELRIIILIILVVSMILLFASGMIIDAWEKKKKEKEKKEKEKKEKEKKDVL